MTTAAPTVATTTAASTAGLAFLGFGDSQGASTEVLAIEFVPGRLPFGTARESDKCKPAWSPCFAVQWDVEVGYRAVLFKEASDFAVGGRKGQIAHV